MLNWDDPLTKPAAPKPAPANPVIVENTVEQTAAPATPIIQTSESIAPAPKITETPIIAKTPAAPNAKPAEPND